MLRTLLSTLAVLFTLLGLAPAAIAQDEGPGDPPQPEAPISEEDLPLTLTERINARLRGVDRVFGKYVVTPLETVLFFDAMFWDNHLRGEAAVGAPHDNGEVIRFDPRRGYEVQTPRVVDRDEVVPIIDGDVTLTFGPAVVTATTVLEDGRARLMGTVQREAAPGADPVALGLPEPPPPGADRAEPYPLRGVAPFTLLYDPNSGTFLPIEGKLPRTSVPVGVGSEVQLGRERLMVTDIDGEDLTVKGGSTRWVEGPVANPANVAFPIVVAWLIFGACFFTVRMQFINIRGFIHAIKVVSGHYDDGDHPGEISHFQALSSALSATVGLGNIAGVAIAVTMGGAGAVFWMVVAGIIGMSSKFTEVTLGQMYRRIAADGVVAGGPMYYLRHGLADMGRGRLGMALSVSFAVLCIGGSFGGGNMFQANQSFAALSDVFPWIADKSWLYGIVLAFLVGIVIIGGIKRIGAAAGVIVPLMCVVYVVSGLVVVMMHASEVPGALLHIVQDAFAPEAIAGGALGAMAVGFQRGAFSNEAGIGSASIAHSAASTSEPVREGIVALLEPFIDTIVVCTVTGLVVVLSGVDPTGAADGVVLTSRAFATVLPWFPYVLTVAVVLFAFSTMISWSYYGERCFTFLFGEGHSMTYRGIFCVFVFLGAILDLGNVLAFSDLMILGMAVPNILGAILLSGKVREALRSYMRRLRAGKFDVAAH